MSDAFYTGMRDTIAGPLLEKYGMALTLRRVTPGAYDPATGAMGASTTVDYPCVGLVDEYKENMIAASVIERGDKKLLVSAKGLSVVPQIGDQFIFPNSDVWYVPHGAGNLVASWQPVTPLSPGGIPIMFTVQVRQ